MAPFNRRKETTRVIAMMIQNKFARACAMGAALLMSSACARVHPRAGRTSLSEPGTKYEVVAAPSVSVEWDIDGSQKMSAVLVGNQGLGNPELGTALHRTGYNGIVELHYADGPSPFVYSYAGLNLEHVLNGKAYEDKKLQFEPRNQPMELRKINDHTYELYQAALPETGVESCTRFEFKSPCYIDVTFECIPRKDSYPYPYLCFFWASYIQHPMG
ncbi:hypothetical protein HY256_04780 [Candidatus Sumerlaeota bacterium]|nr:hypothetical protein [Candidatus Sumerlaeota bacterium]